MTGIEVPWLNLVMASWWGEKGAQDMIRKYGRRDNSDNIETGKGEGRELMEEWNNNI